MTLTLQKREILNSFKLKEFADNNFKFDENGRKFSKRVENNMKKGENMYCKHVKTMACLGKGDRRKVLN